MTIYILQCRHWVDAITIYLRSTAMSSTFIRYYRSHCQVLQLPDSLENVTKYHEDFVKCADKHTADLVCESMREQWSDVLKPGRRVKVKIKDELHYWEYFL